MANRGSTIKGAMTSNKVNEADVVEEEAAPVAPSEANDQEREQDAPASERVTGDEEAVKRAIPEDTTNEEDLATIHSANEVNAEKVEEKRDTAGSVPVSPPGEVIAEYVDEKNDGREMRTAHAVTRLEV